MKIEQWNPEKLVDYARNPRKNDHAVERVAAAIREFGFRVPIIAKSDGLVVDGHLRLKAARKLGLTSVPVVLADDMSETQIKAFRISVNRMAELAEWDTELLALEMQDLTAAGVGIDVAGFSSEEFEALIEVASAEEESAAEIEEDETPEVQDKAITRIGDVWLLGEHRVMCGDSTSKEDTANLFSANRVALCFTSPPYNLGKNVHLRHGPRKTSAYNNISDDSDDWNNLMRNFLANAFCYADVCAVNVQLLAGNKVELLGLFGEFAEKTIDIAIWSKSTSQPAMNEQVMNSAYEFIWLMSNEARPTRRIKTASFERGCFSNVYTSAGARGEHDASVHGAVFPLKFAAHYISNLSLPGSSVYDPFLGSGTTLIAAEQLGRKCYGMELSSQYCDVIVRRWQTLTGKQATRESDGVIFDQAGQA